MSFNAKDILKETPMTPEALARLDELTTYLVPSWVPVVSCLPVLVALLCALLR